MRAAIVPSVNGAWVLKEVPTPEPGPNQVLIKIRASGILLHRRPPDARQYPRQLSADAGP